jgi:predicted SnoaL-like aldol condensation-catalyzing enzyme
MTPAQLIDKYIQLRNAVATIKAKHVTELEPYTKVMLQIETELLDHLNKNQLDSINGPKGTAYKSTVTSVTVDNWSATLDYIRTHELWDLLEARVAKNSTLTTMEETKKAVPGVKITQAAVLRVRAS